MPPPNLLQLVHEALRPEEKIRLAVLRELGVAPHQKERLLGPRWCRGGGANLEAQAVGVVAEVGDCRAVQDNVALEVLAVGVTVKFTDVVT